MRLLNALTLEFEEFIREDETPKYAILSHTWGEEEVTYKDMLESRILAESKKGFVKIKHCVDQALNDGLNYFWIDTCCIDKSSSAELSEAINSMFRWYRNSDVCYAFLSDIPFKPPGLYPQNETELRQLDEIPKSRWFSRAWTLQELIAPRRVVFYSQEFWPFGTKDVLHNMLETWTKIPATVLTTGDYTQQSIAQRMSWAANRQTSRVEDEAYCLLGLFDINMPILYGEGEKAFIRLQHEIIKESDDASIFPWKDPTASWCTYRGLLASSVSHFAACGNILWQPPQDAKCTHKSTNKGIKINLPRKRINNDSLGNNGYLALLPGVSSDEGPAPRRLLGLMLTEISPGQYARVKPENVASLPMGAFEATPEPLVDTAFYVRQKIVLDSDGLAHTRAGGLILSLPQEIRLLDIQPRELWNVEMSAIVFAGQKDVFKHRVITVSCFSPATGEITLVVDVLKEWRAACQVSTAQIGPERKEILQICSEMLMEPGAVESQVIHAGLRGAGLLADCEISLSRGLVKDKWMFRLEVVVGAAPPQIGALETTWGVLGLENLAYF